MERKEAVKVIHKNWSDASFAQLREAPETLIPELKESEDERTRKTLIHIVKGACDKYGIKYKGDEIAEEKLLAYLEKQKDQKPLSTEEIELNSIAFLEQMGYTCIPPGKEQKPAEWSAADEEMLDAMIDIVSNSLYEPLCPREGMLDWLLSLRPRWKPSEEQLEAVRYVSQFDYGGHKAVLVSLYEQLKNL